MGNINGSIETPKTLCRTWNTILGRNKNTIVLSHQKHHLHVGTKTFLHYRTRLFPENSTLKTIKLDFLLIRNSEKVRLCSGIYLSFFLGIYTFQDVISASNPSKILWSNLLWNRNRIFIPLRYSQWKTISPDIFKIENQNTTPKSLWLHFAF